MGTYSKEGTGIIQQGEEEDYFELIDREYIGMAGLIEKASGVKSPSVSIMSAFEFERTVEGETDKYWASRLDTYRKESGRQYPPVFRVRITVEAEALSELETAAWWQKRQQQ